MSEITVRIGTPDDMNFIFESYQNTVVEQNIAHRFHHTQDSFKKALFEDSLATVLIAEKDHQPLGFTLYSVTMRNFTLHMKPGIFVHTLYVNPSYRRQKVASTLLKEVERIGKDKGCNRIDLMVFKTNVHALDLLKSDFDAQEVDNIHYMRISL